MTTTSLCRTATAMVMLATGATVLIAGIFRPQRSGLVIVTLDTTRADRLPAYGFAGVATPTIDALVSRGAVFDEAVSVAPLTLPAHTSLFTGLYPPHHGVRDNGDAPLDRSHTTLAALLRARGFRTGAFVGSVVLSADRGLSEGFDVYDDGSTGSERAPHRRSATEVIDRASAWIRSLNEGASFFLWVHLYDVHAPQTPPLEFRRTYGDRYEGGIAYVDSEIGRLLDVLRQRRLLDHTVQLIAGDHGESLGEHGEAQHGLLVYDSTMHVPLIVAGPGVAPGRIRIPICSTCPRRRGTAGVSCPPFGVPRFRIGWSTGNRCIHDASDRPRYEWSATGGSSTSRRDSRSCTTCRTIRPNFTTCPPRADL